MHTAFSAGTEPTTEMILKQIAESPPLSVTMAEKLSSLRAWARDRCVPAE